MYLQEIVEVAIGLIFAWLLLSIAVLQIQELITSWTGKRSKDLYSTIDKMLNDKKALDKLYKHPLIESLKTPPSGVRNWFSKNFSKSKTSLKPQNPSYIPAETFARALFDVTIKAGSKDSPITTTFQSFREKVEKLKEGDQKTANDLIAYLVNLGQTYAGTQINDLKVNLNKEMLNKLNELEKVGTDSEGNPPLAKVANTLKSYVNGNRADELAFLLGTAEPYLSQVRRGALTHGSRQLGEALNSLLAGVEEYATETDKAIAIGRKNVEAWFDGTMDRLTGWYKRWAQAWAFAIALVIACSFNIDSLHIAQKLWNNPAMRQASAAYIEAYVQEKTADGTALDDTELNQIQKDLADLNFPIGWDEISLKEGQTVQGFWFSKAIGWLITAGAAMQGAPFWFDTLKKLVNIRSSGINPNEKPKSGTSDKER